MSEISCVEVTMDSAICKQFVVLYPEWAEVHEDRSKSVKAWKAGRFLRYTLEAMNRMPERLTSLPDGLRWLVVAPHNDDEVIAVGGILSLLQESEQHRHVSFVTGSATADPKSYEGIRWQEALASADRFGFSWSAWELKDGSVGIQPDEFEANFNKDYKDFSPDIVLCPFLRIIIAITKV